MTGAKDILMEWISFVGGSIGLPDALVAYRNCEEHPLEWLLHAVVPGGVSRHPGPYAEWHGCAG